MNEADVLMELNKFIEEMNLKWPLYWSGPHTKSPSKKANTKQIETSTDLDAEICVVEKLLNSVA